MLINGMYNHDRAGPQLKSALNELMDTVGLARRYAFSYPHELDGGRRQRIGVARALSLNPRSLSSATSRSPPWTCPFRHQILNSFEDLQEELRPDLYVHYP